MSDKPSMDKDRRNWLIATSAVGGVGAAAANSDKQLAALDDSTGGANWYSVSDDALKDIFAGKDVDTTLDKGAAVLAKNFANFAKS